MALLAAMVAGRLIARVMLPLPVALLLVLVSHPVPAVLGIRLSLD